MRTGRLPTWALAALMVFLIGFRLGLNAFDATVIDVGYAGTVGADRVLRGQLPYGNFPDSSGTPCGVKHLDGTSSAYRQAKQDGRCESPVANGDTYGPVNYAAYVPAVAVTGWTGRWDDLPASHGTSCHLRPRVRRRHGRRSAGASGACASRSCAGSRGSPIRSPATRCRRTRTT